MKRWVVVALLLVGCEGCGASGPPPPPAPSGPSAGPGHVAGARRAPAAPGEDPSGARSESGATAAEAGEPTEEAAEGRPQPVLSRAELAALDAARCHDLLRTRGVSFEPVAAAEAEGVVSPIRLTGPVGGIPFVHGGRSDRYAILDCRLAIALLGWAPALAASGIERVEHMSIYRPGARVRRTGETSGHAAGTAIDAARFLRADGSVLEVERDWTDKARGAEPCRPREDEAEPQRTLRRLVCDAVEADLFQVVVTPHANARHSNHVHLEIRPDVDWTHVR